MEQVMETITATQESEATTSVGAEDTFASEELYSENEQQEAREQTAETDGVDGQSPGEEQIDQRRIGEAFRRERERIQRQFEEQYSPAIDVGMRLIEDIMSAKGVSMQQAAAIAEQNYIKAWAAREGVSENAARRMLTGQRQAAREPRQDMQTKAVQFWDEVYSMDLPSGFDPVTAVQDIEFVELLTEMPTKRAVELYHAKQAAGKAPQEIADKLRARQAIPRAEKVQQPAKPKLDFDTMPSEDFHKFKREKQAREMR